MHEYTGDKKRFLSLAIEQRTAKELIRKYKNRRSGDDKGKYGADRIVEDIYAVVGGRSIWSLTGHDLKHWLEDRTDNLGDNKFPPIKEFIVSDEFGKVVPEAKHYLNSLLRTIEIGCSFAQAHGYDLDVKNCRYRLRLDGTWMLSQNFTENLLTETEPVDDLSHLSRMMALLDYAQTVEWFAQIRSISGYGFSIAHFLDVDKRPAEIRPSFKAPTDGCVKSSGFLFQESGGAIDGLMWNREKNRTEYRCNLILNPNVGSAFILRPTNEFRGFINPTNKPLLAFRLSRFFEILNKHRPVDTTGNDAKQIETLRNYLLKERHGVEETIGKLFDRLGFSVISKR